MQHEHREAISNELNDTINQLAATNARDEGATHRLTVKALANIALLVEPSPAPTKGDCPAPIRGDTAENPL